MKLFRSLPSTRQATTRSSTLRFVFQLCAGLLIAAATAGTALAQTYTYNFNSGQSNFDSTFTSNGGGGNGVATISSTVGIGTPLGSVSTDGVTNHTIIFNTPLNNSTGGTITTSFFFETRPTLATGDLVGFGLLASTSQLWGSTNSIFYKINGNNSLNLLASTWYQLVATTTNTGSTFHTTISLESYGSTGTTASGSVTTLGASDTTSGTLLTTSSVYVGLYGGQLANGPISYMTPGIDNFSVSVSAIPEPSTYAAIAGAAMLGLAVWKRRRPPALVTTPATPAAT